MARLTKKLVAMVALAVAAPLLTTAAGCCSICASGDRTLERRATLADDGREIVLEPRDRLRVELPAEPGEGVLWAVAALDATILAPTGNPRLVDPGTMELDFVAKVPGRTVLLLAEREPARSEAVPRRVWKILVVVQPGGALR